jgi:hypothetical protein
MPVRSKAQLGKLAELEKAGKVKPGTVKQWVRDTPGGIKNLPERIHPRNPPQSTDDLRKIRKNKFGV